MELDKQLLKNILINLLSNGCKYSSEGKTIHLRTEVNHETVSITVQDQGIGIPAADQTHLFTPFFRAQNATNIQGTGLGLNIVKRYVEVMEGSMQFTSELNKGTTFILTFPKENHA